MIYDDKGKNIAIDPRDEQPITHHPSPPTGGSVVKSLFPVSVSGLFFGAVCSSATKTSVRHWVTVCATF